MRGCLTTFIFLLVSSGLLSFIVGSLFLLIMVIEPQADGPFDVHWYTAVLSIAYIILMAKLMVKISRAISNYICDFLFGKEDEQ